MRNRILLVGAAVLVLAVLVAAAVVGWRALRPTELQRAVGLAPAGSERLTWTDWAGVRERTGSRVGPSSGPADLERFLAAAYDDDLSQMSALVESAEAMQESYGFSPASLEWELLASSEQGTAVVMQLPESTDMEALGDRIEELGYERPDSETGVWVGGPDLLPRIGTLTPELQYVGIDADQHVVVGSDERGYAGRAMAAVTGEAEGFEGLDTVVEAVGEPLSAAIYGGDVVCETLAMGSADARDQAAADQLLSRAGEVDPLTGFAMARSRGEAVRVAMAFADEDQARVNADSRSRLASGPAPGQGGTFGERFRLGRVAAEGELLTMELDPREGIALLSDLTSGPVLFATC